MPHRGETEEQAETRRLAFEERRVQRVDGHIWELERDHPEIFTAVEQNIIHVPYYGTKEEQDRFLNSIEDIQIGQEMLRLQTKFNKDYRIPLILPKFSNFPNITINEQQWLAMFGIVIDVTAQTIGSTSKPDAFKRIEQAYQAAVTEEVTVEAEPGITLDSSVLAEEEFKTKWYMVTFPSGKIEKRKVSQKFVDKMTAQGWIFRLIIEEPEPEQKETWWVTKPSGIIEQVSVTPSGKTKLESLGWKFSKEKPAEPEPVNVDKVTTNMIKQELLNFTIVNNRVQGSIKFTTTDLFNPYYYNKPLTNYLQLKSNDKSIHIKSNKLIFFPPKVGIDYTEHVMSFNENAYDLNIINMESYVRNYADLDMSSVLEFTIEVDKEPTVTPTVTPGKTGLMGMGVVGVIGILMLGGFIADHVRKRK